MGRSVGGRLGQGGQNGGYRRPSIGAKAIKSCGPHPQKTAAFFPRSRLYAVIKSGKSVLGYFCTCAKHHLH